MTSVGPAPFTMMHRSLARTGLSLVLSAALCHASASDVWVVDASGNGDFTNIQPAVLAAADGDTLLVRPGSYGNVELVGKSLSILGEGGNVVVKLVNVGHVRVEGVPAGGHLVLAGLNILAPEFFDAPRRSGLLMQDVQGPARVQDCFIEGAEPFPGNVGNGGHGAEVVDCGNVTFVRCMLQGGAGPDGPGPVSQGYDGGDGLHAESSRVLIQDGRATGGNAGGGDGGGIGGDGAWLTGSSQVGSFNGALIIGGAGGSDWYAFFGPGKGGAGLRIVDGAAGRSRDTTFKGGLGGGNGFGAPPGAGQPGLPIDNDSGTTYFGFLGLARDLSIVSHGWSGGELTARVRAQPGDELWLLDHAQTTWTFVFPLAGVWTLPAPYLRPLVSQDVVPASGELELTVELPTLTPGQASLRRYMQAFVLSAAGVPHTTAPHAVATLDCTKSMDWDQNGQPDGCEIAAGTAPDCNGNGQLDAFDIATGWSKDQDLDGVPDECQ